MTNEKKAFEMDQNDFEAKSKVMPKMSEGFREWLTGIRARTEDNKRYHNERMKKDFPESKPHPMDELIHSGAYDTEGSYRRTQRMHDEYFPADEIERRRKAKENEPRHPMDEAMREQLRRKAK